MATTKKTTEPVKLGDQVAFHSIPETGQDSVDRLALVVQLLDEEIYRVALSVYNPMGLTYLASVEQGTEPGQYSLIENNQ